MASKVLSLTKFATKSGVAGGAIYLTAQQGVWSSCNSGSEVLDKVRQSVLPATDEYIRRVPALKDVMSTGLAKWNSGVQFSFSHLATVPGKVGEYSRKAYLTSTSSIRDRLKSTPNQ